MMVLVRVYGELLDADGDRDIDLKSDSCQFDQQSVNLDP